MTEVSTGFGGFNGFGGSLVLAFSVWGATKATSFLVSTTENTVLNGEYLFD
jgi:hypothetical protein